MVFGLFSKEKALQRTIKKATNKLAQSAERWAALEKLRDDGSEEALYALLRRFSFSSLKSIEDQDEKEWVIQTLIAKGEVCLPALQRFMKNAPAVGYPLRILEGICRRERALEVIDDLLAVEEPGYTRDPTKRTQIMNFLTHWPELEDEDVAVRVIPYLADFDEGVRFAAVESLSQRPSPSAAEPLVNALIRPEEESKRLKVRIIEVLAEQQLDLYGHKKKVQPLIDEYMPEYRIQKDKLVMRKKAKKS